MNDRNNLNHIESECRFCQLGSGRAAFNFDRPLLQSEDYFAIASIGGFVDGWTLVCPKRHGYNLSRDYQKDSFQRFVKEVAEIVSSEYGNVVAFEHGATTAGSLTGCGTDHAHLHLVPFSGSLVDRTVEYDPDVSWLSKTPGQMAMEMGNREYLLMSDDAAALMSSSLVAVMSQPNSQFFRKVLSSGTGYEGKHDYRLFPFTEEVTRTALRLHQAARRLETADSL